MTNNRPERADAEPHPGEWLQPEDFAHAVRVTPLVSIDLVVRDRRGRTLLGHRHHEPAKGFFFVPGGRITKNESLAAAFDRISRCELGLAQRIDAARFLGVFEHFYKANRLQAPGFGTHYVVLAYELLLDLDPAELPKDQHGHYAWMSPEELLGRDDVHPNTKAYFQGGSETQRSSALSKAGQQRQ